MKTVLEKCYNVIYRKSKKLHKLAISNKSSPDGLVFWKSIKEILSKYDDQCASEWNPTITEGELHDKFYDRVISLPETIIYGDGSVVTLSNNHFFIQIFRIPTKDKPIFRKIMQIALNAGQLEHNLKQFDKKLVSDYKMAKVWKLTNFIDESEFKNFKLPSNLPRILDEKLKVDAKSLP